MASLAIIAMLFLPCALDRAPPRLSPDQGFGVLMQEHQRVKTLISVFLWRAKPQSYGTKTRKRQKVETPLSEISASISMLQHFGVGALECDGINEL
jgi:hypothetical protein